MWRKLSFNFSYSALIRNFSGWLSCGLEIASGFLLICGSRISDEEEEEAYVKRYPVAKRPRNSNFSGARAPSETLPYENQESFKNFWHLWAWKYETPDFSKFTILILSHNTVIGLWKNLKRSEIGQNFWLKSWQTTKQKKIFGPIFDLIDFFEKCSRIEKGWKLVRSLTFSFI